MTDKEIFERDGFLEVPGIIIDPKNLFTEPPKNHNGSRTSGSLKYSLIQEPHIIKMRLKCLAHFQCIIIQSIERYIV